MDATERKTNDTSRDSKQSLHCNNPFDSRKVEWTKPEECGALSLVGYERAARGRPSDLRV